MGNRNATSRVALRAAHAWLSYLNTTCLRPGSATRPVRSASPARRISCRGSRDRRAARSLQRRIHLPSTLALIREGEGSLRSERKQTEGSAHKDPKTNVFLTAVPSNAHATAQFAFVVDKGVNRELEAYHIVLRII